MDAFPRDILLQLPCILFQFKPKNGLRCECDVFPMMWYQSIWSSYLGTLKILCLKSHSINLLETFYKNMFKCRNRKSRLHGLRDPTIFTLALEFTPLDSSERGSVEAIRSDVSSCFAAMGLRWNFSISLERSKQRRSPKIPWDTLFGSLELLMFFRGGLLKYKMQNVSKWPS